MLNSELKNNSSGFTIVELLVGVTILVIALSFMYGIYFSGQDLWELQRDKLDLQAEARTAMENMCNELKQATRANPSRPPKLLIPASPGNTTINFYLPSYDAVGMLLTDAQGQISWAKDNPIDYTYFPGQKQLKRIEGNNVKILAQDVNSVQFIDASIDNSLLINEVKIILTLGRTTTRHRNVYFTLSSTIKTRNY